MRNQRTSRPIRETKQDRIGERREEDRRGEAFRSGWSVCVCVFGPWAGKMAVLLNRSPLSGQWGLELGQGVPRGRETYIEPTVARGWWERDGKGPLWNYGWLRLRSRQIGDFSPFSYLSSVIIARGGRMRPFFLLITIKNGQSCNVLVLFNELFDIFKINGRRCAGLRRKRSWTVPFISKWYLSKSIRIKIKKLN